MRRRARLRSLPHSKGLLDTYDFLSFEPSQINVDGSLARAEVHFRYRDKASGEVIDSCMSDFWAVEAGKAKRLDKQVFVIGQDGQATSGRPNLEATTFYTSAGAKPRGISSRQLTIARSMIERRKIPRCGLCENFKFLIAIPILITLTFPPK